jgi:hypothetical protein
MEIPHTAKVDTRREGGRKHATDRREVPAVEFLARPLAAAVSAEHRRAPAHPHDRGAQHPLVGWIAENLYRDKKDAGWCLEADPGQSEYVVFYAGTSNIMGTFLIILATSFFAACPRAPETFRDRTRRPFD